uniref:Uncharacterized protein n=1 Tax=Timema cristinae TaxID=61476 RepID=A0A7R9H7N4_TIMCR|nr:unnamed protein product [Timema cristinae]
MFNLDCRHLRKDTAFVTTDLEPLSPPLSLSSRLISLLKVNNVNDQMTLRTAVPVALSPLYPTSKLDIGIVEMSDLVYVRSISAACGVACVTDS